MKTKYKSALLIPLAAIIVCYYKLKAYQESVSSKAAATHNIEMLEKALQSNGAVKVGEHSWTYPDNWTNAIHSTKTNANRKLGN